MKVQVTKLENGLRVATDFMADVESVSVSIWVRTGSRNETEAINGVSHFLEHMAFKGTKNRTAKQIAEHFDEIGGKVNAFTSHERTVYYAKVLKDDVETAIEILSDILQNSMYDKKAVENERKIILQEIAMVKDTPDDIIFDYYNRTAFPNQPFGRNILGTSQNVKNFKQADLLHYITEQYRTEDIVIGISGKSKHVQNVKLVRKYFKKLKTGKNKEAEPAIYAGGDFRKQRKLEQLHMILGFDGYSYRSKDFYKAGILGAILGGGLSSRLFQEIREKRGLCYSICAFNSSASDNGSFKIYTGVSPKKTNELIDAVIAELKKAMTQITKEELKRAVTQLKASILMARENTNKRAQRIASDLLAYGKVRTVTEIIKDIESIKVADLQKLLKEIVTRSRPTLAMLGNIEGAYSYEEVVEKLKSEE